MQKAVAETSIAAFAELLPTLARREREALDALLAYERRHGRWPTSYELVKFSQAFDVNTIRPRLTALKEKGLVVAPESEKRRCSVTGKKALTWQPVYPGRLF